MAKKQFAVIGLGRFGNSVCKTLHDLGFEVMGIDENAEMVQAAHDEAIATHVVQLDSTNRHALEDAGVAEFDTAVVSIGSDLEASILTVLNLLDLKISTIVVKAADERHGQVLERIAGKAIQVVYPEKQMGERVARFLSGTGVLDSIELDPDYTIAEILVPGELVGKTLAESNLRARYGVTVIAIKTRHGINIAPLAEDLALKGDVLTVLGTNEQIHALQHRQR